MNLLLTPELRRAAKRCVWFEAPEKAIRLPARLAAYILTYGLPEDVHALRAQLNEGELTEFLDAAPPGIFDERSWAYWNLIIGRADAPALPERLIPGS